MNYGKLTAGITKTAIDTAKSSEKGEIITYLSRMGDVLKEVAERGQVVFALLGVYTVVYGYEVNIVLCEHDLRVHSYLKVVTSKSGHILDDYPLDNTGFYSLNHSLEVRAFKCRAGVTIVYKELIVRIAVLLGIVQKDFLLVLDTVAVAVIGVIH